MYISIKMFYSRDQPLFELDFTLVLNLQIYHHYGENWRKKLLNRNIIFKIKTNNLMAVYMIRPKLNEASQAIKNSCLNFNQVTMCYT